MSVHASIQMARRELTESMIKAGLRNGNKYFDPKNRSIVYVVEKGFVSGQNLQVARTILTNVTKTVIRSKKVPTRLIKLPW